jgi:hypothetical protein
MAPSSRIRQHGFLRLGYNSAIEVPEPTADADYYSLKDVPRGRCVSSGICRR